MPDRTGEGRAYPIRIADEFVIGLAHIWSKRLLKQIENLLQLLPSNPELGSPRVRSSLVQRYGDHLRMLAVSTFVIVYRFDGTTVDVLALVYGPSVV